MVFIFLPFSAFSDLPPAEPRATAAPPPSPVKIGKNQNMSPSLYGDILASIENASIFFCVRYSRRYRLSVLILVVLCVTFGPSHMSEGMDFFFWHCRSRPPSNQAHICIYSPVDRYQQICIYIREFRSCEWEIEGSIYLQRAAQYTFCWILFILVKFSVVFVIFFFFSFSGLC